MPLPNFEVEIMPCTGVIGSFGKFDWIMYRVTETGARVRIQGGKACDTKAEAYTEAWESLDRLIEKGLVKP